MMFISQKLYKREPSSKVGRRVVKPVFIEKLTSEAYGKVRMDVILCSLQLLTGPGTRIPVICRVTLKPLSNTAWPALSHLCGIQVLLFSAFFFFLVLRFLVYLRNLHGPGHVFSTGSIQFTCTCSLLLKELKQNIIAVTT